MSKPATTISTRNQHIATIADEYVSISGKDPNDFVTDLLADLMHYSAANGVRFAASLLRAQGHFTAERVEEGLRH
jgi:hypothetical protein